MNDSSREKTSCTGRRVFHTSRPSRHSTVTSSLPPSGAVEYEVDFENSITDVRVVTYCNAVPDVRQGPSKGCGLTLPQLAWNDIANANRDGDPVKVSVRATCCGCPLKALSSRYR